MHQNFERERLVAIINYTRLKKIFHGGKVKV
jgi:hypothetical protein